MREHVSMRARMHPRKRTCINTFQPSRWRSSGDCGVGFGNGVVVLVMVKTVVLVMVMAVTMMPDDSQGPGIGQSFIIFAFCSMKKNILKSFVYLNIVHF